MAYSYEPTTLPAMMKVQDAPRSPSSVVDAGYPAPNMMLKDTVPPTQRAEIVHDPADMVARRNARASFLVAVMVFAVLSVTKLMDVSFLDDAPATPNDEANTLSVSQLAA